LGQFSALTAGSGEAGTTPPYFGQVRAYPFGQS
jgi:hypothetical protein